MNRRVIVLVAILLAAGAGRWQLQAVEPAASSDLAKLPMALDEWSGRPGSRFDADVLSVLRADDYVNRIYTTSGRAAGLYVGYSRAQKFGATIHSPLNCLPGAGWQPLHTERVALGERGTVNRVLIEKGEDKQVVVYWYQSATRIEGNEYWSKFYLFADAFRSRRNDAALVRVIVPVSAARADGEAVATADAMRMAQLVEPHVSSLLFP